MFKENTPWIWENLDSQTVNNLLAEHNEIHRDPEEKQREKMSEELTYQVENNPLVKQFMEGG